MVQVYDARRRQVGRRAGLIARPHHTFARVMSQMCRLRGLDLADYDVWSGALLLNGCTDQIRTFGIPDGEWLEVAMHPKSMDSCF